MGTGERDGEGATPGVVDGGEHLHVLQRTHLLLAASAPVRLKLHRHPPAAGQGVTRPVDKPSEPSCSCTVDQSDSSNPWLTFFL